MDKSDLLVAILTSVSSIIAIFISASVTRRAERENYKRQFLSDAYSNLFIRYARWLDTRNSNDKGALLAAIEQARLLAAPETELLLKDFEKAITHGSNADVLGSKLKPLRCAMRLELQHKPRTKRSKKAAQKSNPKNA